MNQLARSCAIEHEGTTLPTFPILMPASWQRAPTQVCAPLIRGATLANIPLVAPVHFVGDPNQGSYRRMFIRSERLLAIGKTEHQYLSEAVSNLRCRRASWYQLVQDILVCSDDFLSAERILDVEFMAGAARLLSDDSVVAAVPRRGHLFATSWARFMSDASHAVAFANACAAMFSTPGADVISPWPFLVRDGRILCVLETEHPRLGT